MEDSKPCIEVKLGLRNHELALEVIRRWL